MPEPPLKYKERKGNSMCTALNNDAVLISGGMDTDWKPKTAGWANRVGNTLWNTIKTPTNRKKAPTFHFFSFRSNFRFTKPKKKTKTGNVIILLLCFSFCALFLLPSLLPTIILPFQQWILFRRHRHCHSTVAFVASHLPTVLLSWRRAGISSVTRRRRRVRRSGPRKAVRAKLVVLNVVLFHWVIVLPFMTYVWTRLYSTTLLIISTPWKNL